MKIENLKIFLEVAQIIIYFTIKALPPQRGSAFYAKCSKMS